MLIDPNDSLFAFAVALGAGFIAGVLWDHIWKKQPRDERGGFQKR